MFAKRSTELIKLPVRYSTLKPTEKFQIRRMYIELQKEMCHFCHAPIHEDVPKDIKDIEVTPHLYPEGFFKNPIHLHHNHDTDLTIGAVHAKCNAILWEYEGE